MHGHSRRSADSFRFHNRKNDGYPAKSSKVTTMGKIIGCNTWLFVSASFANWLMAMLFVYVMVGREAIGLWSALGALTVPAIWFLARRVLFWQRRKGTYHEHA
jgi:hypothetical protein